MTTKQGCGQMFCKLCGYVDETHTAYCSNHGRSYHLICGESKKNLCPSCKKEAKQ
jgi:hypothetical protein